LSFKNTFIIVKNNCRLPVSSRLVHSLEIKFILLMATLTRARSSAKEEKERKEKGTLTRIQGQGK
jgi:hypothetical protein